MGKSFGSSDELFPSVALNQGGDIFVSWGLRNSVDVVKWDPASAAWQPQGDTINAVNGQHPDSFDTRRVSMAVDSTGAPYVAFLESDGTNTNVYIEHWIGNSWQLQGGAINTTPPVNIQGAPSIAIDDSNRPVVTFTANVNAYVVRWDSNANKWQQIGYGVNAVGGGAGVSYQSALTLDRSGNPVIAFAEPFNSKTMLYVFEWDGNTTWKSLGGALNDAEGSVTATKVGIVNVAALREAGGNIDIAYAAASGQSSKIYAKSWDGFKWLSLGAPVDGAADGPGGAFDHEGRLVLAFPTSSTPQGAAVVRINR
jgi:hypothetical protein